MSSSPPLPRGTPLTPVMEFTDSSGRAWLAYVEATPPVRRWRFLSETVLPGRRVRFDAADESRVTPMVPAGSPFLPEPRLQVLLAGCAALPPIPAMEPAPAPAHQHGWELVRAGVRAGARRGAIIAASARTALQHLISGYRTLVSRGVMVHHR
ncbi:MAG TPA: hypothetical protein VFT28_04850 [Gemmatimonadales bacterium]|nr:hypothetical protein [Gemmatimonadales bacterium]